MSLLDYIETVALIGGVIIYVYNYFRQRKRKRRQSVDAVVALNDRLYPILWQLLIEYKAIRVSILQFHNGEIYYTGQSIQRNTMTHEVCGPDIKPMKPQIDNRLTSNVIHHIIKMSRDTEHWGFASLDQFQLGMQRTNDEDDFRTECKIHDVSAAHWFRITNKNSNVVGMLCMHWDMIQPLDSAALANIRSDIKVLENIFEKAKP